VGDIAVMNLIGVLTGIAFLGVVAEDQYGSSEW
jgi:hypothetical protein